MSNKMEYVFQKIVVVQNFLLNKASFPTDFHYKYDEFS